jgi:F-type H+-transporting ATPase subunit epsilon
MLARLQTFSLFGIEAIPVDVEVDVSGGALPATVLVGMADTAIRGKDLDEAKASEAKQRAEEAMKNAKSDIDLAAAQSEFAAMAAQLAAIAKLRKK